MSLLVLNWRLSVKLLDELLEQLRSARSVGSYQAGQMAAEALRKLGDHRAVEPLIAALGAPDYNRREADTIAIPLRGPEAAKVRFRESVATALGLLRDIRAIGPLINALHDDPRVTSRAIDALAQYDFEEVEQPVTCALQQGNRYIQENGARVLARTNDKRAIAPLIKLLKDGDNTVRSSAADALGCLADVRAVDALIDALEEDDRRIREKAVESLGRLGDTRAVDPLVRLLEDQNAVFWGKSAEALGRLGDKRAVDPLIASLERGGFGVREAVLALG